MADLPSPLPPTSPSMPPLASTDSTHLTSTPTPVPQLPTDAPLSGSSDIDSTLHTPHTSEENPNVVPIETSTEDTPSSIEQHAAKAASPPSPLGLSCSPPSRASRRSPLSPPPSLVDTSSRLIGLQGAATGPTRPVLNSQIPNDPSVARPLGDSAGPSTVSRRLPECLQDALDAVPDEDSSGVVSPHRSSSPLPSSSPLSGRGSPHSSPPPSPASPDPFTSRASTPYAPIDDARSSSGSSPLSGSPKSEEQVDSSPRSPVTYLSRKRSIRQEEAPAKRSEDLIEELLEQPDPSTSTGQPGSADPRVKRRRLTGSSTPTEDDVFAAPKRTFPQQPSKLTKRYPPLPAASHLPIARRTAGPSAYGESREKKVRFVSSSRLQDATSKAGEKLPHEGSKGSQDLFTREPLSLSGDSPRSADVPIVSRPTPDSPRPPLIRRPPIDPQPALDQGILLSVTNPRGVHVATDGAIKAGHVIAQLTPLHPILHTRLLESNCAGCLLDPIGKAAMERKDEKVVAGRFLQCGRCEMVWFCSLKCYAKSAQNHFDECRALIKITHIPSAEVRLLARACTDRANGKMLPEAEALLPLTHYEMLQLGPLIRDLVAFLSRAHRVAWGKEHLSYKQFGFGSIIDLFTFIRETRQHIVPITDSKGFPLGLCLSPTTSKFGHSCRPNAHLCWPFGMGVEKPLRVIALDDIDGGDEVILSHVDLSTKLYERADRLSIKGYIHQCGWCERELKSIDVRWSARHLDCPEEGLIALRDDHPQAHVTRTDPGPACESCGEIYPETGLDEYGTLLETLKPYLQADAEGAWLVDMMPDDKSITAELAFLEKAVEHLLIGYPDTVHPIPTLHRRLARIYLQNPNPTFEQILRAIELLQLVYDAHHLMNFEEPRQITLSCLVDQVQAHLKIIEMNSYKSRGWRGISVERGDSNKRKLLANQLDQAESLIREANAEADKIYGPSGGGMVVELRRHKRNVGKYRKWFDENMDDGSSWEPVDEVLDTRSGRDKGSQTKKWLDGARKAAGAMERVLESKENVGRRPIGVGRTAPALTEIEGNTEGSSSSSEEMESVKELETGGSTMDSVLNTPPGKRRKTC